MEWKRCEDGRLPDKEVLCINKRKDYIIGYVGEFNHGAYQAENDHEILEHVTHWMPLPEPPTE